MAKLGLYGRNAFNIFRHCTDMTTGIQFDLIQLNRTELTAQQRQHLNEIFESITDIERVLNLLIRKQADTAIDYLEAKH